MNGSPLGYLSTTDPNTPASTPFIQSGGLLLQGLTGTPSAFLWTSPAGASKTDHVFTTGMVPDGYTEEATTGYLLQSSGSGTRALRRYVNSTGSHFYTTDTLNDPPVGYALDTTLGNLEPDGTNGGVVLYRYANTTTGDYLLDTSPVAPSGYGAGVNLGYIRVVGAPSGGIVTTYTRNALGQLLQASNPNVTYTYTYDAAHRLQSVTDSRGPKRLTYTYSPGGRLTSVTDTDGGRTDYTYDAVGRLTGLWAPTGDLVTFAYDAGGRLMEKTFPNGANTRYTYNPDNTLARVINRVGFSDSNVISQHDYTYDGVGNRLTHIERIGATTTKYKYGYDPLDRLLEVRDGATDALIQAYTYDPLDNRLSKNVGGALTYYAYNTANELTQYCEGTPNCGTPKTFTYDPNGNLVARTDGLNPTTLIYDVEDRLAWVGGPGQVEQTYAYDPDGRRVRKTTGNLTTQFLYDGPDIIAEYATWAGPTARYVHGAATDDPLLRATCATPQACTAPQYYHQDGLGSMIALSNASGGTDATQRFDAWGVRIAGAGTIPQYGYTGREPDETGLIYYRARYYDPTLGRFTQRDPGGFQGGVNPYAYADGNPVTLTDPDGLAAFNPAFTLGVNTQLSYFNTSVAPTTTLSVGQRAWAGVTGVAAFVGGMFTGAGALTAAGIGTGALATGVGAPAAPAAYGAAAVLGAATLTQWDFAATNLLTAFSGRPQATLLEQAVGPTAAGGIALGLAFTPGGIASAAGGAGVAPYQVGTYGRLARLSRGDTLAIHHVGQQHVMRQLIAGYDPKLAPAIAVPIRLHLNIPKLAGQFIGTARDLLARDIRNLRTYTDAPTSSLRLLIRMNKDLYPGSFLK